MLSSIHPFGERSRNNSFGRTAGAHLAGSAVGGAALGVVAGGLGSIITRVASPTDDVRVTLVLASALAALLLEATSRERLLPTRARQVNENWIQTYRGWVYGGGFGAELGFGISTIITTTLVHLLVVSMLLVGSIPLAILLGVTFGVVRGATVFTTRNIDSPEGLRLFHQRLDAMRTRSRSGAVASLAIASVVGLAAVLL
jgi:hypothetical protein